MSRTQIILGAALLVQLVLLFSAVSPFSSQASGVVAAPFLPALDSLDPMRLSIEDGAGKSVTVERTGADAAWTLADAGGYPVDGAKVDELLSSLKGLEVRRPVVSSSRYHEALKVARDAHERRLRIWEDPSTEPAADLFLGTSPNYRLSHARLGGDDRVYEVSLGTWDLRSEAASWIDKKLVDLPAEEISRFRMKNGAGEFVLEKYAGNWILAAPALPSGKVLDTAKVDGLVRSFASLFLAQPVGPLDGAAHGTDEPAALVELVRTTPAEAVLDDSESETGGADQSAAPADERVIVRIGAEVPDGAGKRYAAKEGFGFAVELSKFDADKAVAKKLSELLIDEPAP